MQYNLMIIESLFVLLNPVLSHYNYDVRPDVTFGDHNARFDVSDLVSYQNKYFRADGSIDYRRSHGKGIHKFLRTAWNPNDKKWLLGSERNQKKLTQKVMRETEEQLNNLANIILLRMKSRRRAGENNFVYHDSMESEGGNIRDFNENIERFQKPSIKEDDRNGRQTRMDYRRVDTIPDTFNYAFPIEMHVEGYLLPPEDQ